VMSIVAASAVGVDVPVAYTARINKTECGEGPGGTCGSELYAFATDIAKQRSRYDFLHSDGSTNTSVHCGDLNLIFSWDTPKGGNPGPCTTTMFPSSFGWTSEWAWLTLNTTEDKGIVDCPRGKQSSNADCHLYQGPWPEQVTIEADLWLSEQGGKILPLEQDMYCAILPFSLKYLYSGWNLEPPPASLLEPRADCPKTPSPTAPAPLRRWPAMLDPNFAGTVI